jgi:hypothetical protein
MKKLHLREGTDFVICDVFRGDHWEKQQKEAKRQKMQ